MGADLSTPTSRQRHTMFALGQTVIKLPCSIRIVSALRRKSRKLAVRAKLDVDVDD